MKYLILLLFGLSFSQSPGVNVSEAGFDKLAPADQARAIQYISQLAKATDSTKSTVAQVSQWVDVGARLGLAIASCAKELGVAANEFLKTPVGKISFVLLAWKVMAKDIIHVGGGLLLLLIGFIVFRYFHIAFCIESVTYGEKKAWWSAQPKVVKRKNMSTEEFWALFCVVVIFVGAASGAIFSI